MRTFLALDLDEHLQRQLADIQDDLESAGAAVRWTRPDQLHVTAKFLGDVADEDIAEVCSLAEAVAGNVEPFSFDVGHVSSAPPHGYMRMVWVGIDDTTGRLGELARQLDLVYSGLGFRADHRGFHPHLTLGRVKSARNVPQLRQAITMVADARLGAQPAEELTVYASELTREGPIYTPMVRYPLSV